MSSGLGIRRSPELERLICGNDLDVTGEEKDDGTAIRGRAAHATSPSIAEGDLRDPQSPVPTHEPRDPGRVAVGDREPHRRQASVARLGGESIPRSKTEVTPAPLGDVTREERGDGPHNVCYSDGPARDSGDPVMGRTPITLAPATLPAREGGETSEGNDSISQGPAGVMPRLPPAEAPIEPAYSHAPVEAHDRLVTAETPSRDLIGAPSSHWLGPAGVFVDALLGRTT